MANSIKLLGLSKKAGRLEIGEESVGAAARAKKAKVILAACDASDNLKRRAENFSAAGKAPLVVLPYSKLELGCEVGRGSPGLLAITDVGLAAGFVSKLAAEFPQQYESCREELEQKAAKAMQRKKEAKAHERNLKMGKRRTK